MGAQREQVEVLAIADALEAEGRLLEAVDLLQAANVEVGAVEVERRLVALRHAAFGELVATPRGSAPADPAPVPPPRPDDIPTVRAADLTPGTVRSGIDEGGCLLVRGLLPTQLVERLVDDIDRAVAGYDAHVAGAPASETAPWFEPFEPSEPYRANVAKERTIVRGDGGAWASDSPRGLFDLVEAMRQTGLLEVVTGFLGERPALSRAKSTLRRVAPTHYYASWHQDGAFLGTPLRSLNVWMALSDCGEDAATMDILPKRLDGIVETGTEGSIFNWAASTDKVLEAADGVPIRRPVFRAGDVLLFDELFMHRTACEPEMTKDRYAIEAWTFAPSVYPDRQVPIVV